MKLARVLCLLEYEICFRVPAHSHRDDDSY